MVQSIFYEVAVLRGQRYSLTYTEPEGSSPCSQDPATGPQPEADEGNPHPQILHF